MRGFNVDYDQRLASLQARRVPSEFTANQGEIRMSESLQKSASAQTIERYSASGVYEVYKRLQKEDSSVRYAVGAMQPVDPVYNRNTFREGDRVKNQLENLLKHSEIRFEYRYQGSVTNNTNIRAHSDIDLLVIHGAFVTLERPQVPANPYAGDPLEDLSELRSDCIQGLKNSFEKADVCDTNAKSIRINGGSLRREIDVVPANWYDTNQFASTRADHDRGVQIFDCMKRTRILNKPFLHNYLIEHKDRNVSGGLRKTIRLLKSLRYDSGSVSLSSYVIAAIAYNMEEYELATAPGDELRLLVRIKQNLDRLSTDSQRRETMVVPNGLHKVFSEGHGTLKGLNELRVEVDDLVEAVRSNMAKSFRKLGEARVEY
jgi:hypothetical protein